MPLEDAFIKNGVIERIRPDMATATSFSVMALAFGTLVVNHAI